MWWHTRRNQIRLLAKRNPYKLAEASVQSTTGSWGVRVSGSNAGYTMFPGSVKGTGYPLHSPVSPSLLLSYVTMCHHISTGLYHLKLWIHLFCHSIRLCLLFYLKHTKQWRVFVKFVVKYIFIVAILRVVLIGYPEYHQCFLYNYMEFGATDWSVYRAVSWTLASLDY